MLGGIFAPEPIPRYVSLGEKHFSSASNTAFWEGISAIAKMKIGIGNSLSGIAMRLTVLLTARSKADFSMSCFVALWAAYQAVPAF